MAWRGLAQWVLQGSWLGTKAVAPGVLGLALLVVHGPEAPRPAGVHVAQPHQPSSVQVSERENSNPGAPR